MVNALYALVNVIPLPFWFLMIVLPNRDITRRVSSRYTVFLALGALYMLMMMGVVITLLTAPRGAPLDFSTAEGLAAAFANPVAALVVWLHNIVYVGVSIALTALFWRDFHVTEQVGILGMILLAAILAPAQRDESSQDQQPALQTAQVTP